MIIAIIIIIITIITTTTSLPDKLDSTAQYSTGSQREVLHQEISLQQAQ